MSNRLFPAVFLDRDGTLMHDCDYCSDPADVRIFPNVVEALARLKARGFKLVVITNQSGIGRGFFTLEQYRAVEAEILRQAGDGLIDATYFCPDAPETSSNCRKPSAGMVLQAAQKHQIDLSQSFFVGDKEVDVECAHNAGVRAIRVKTGSQQDMAATRADWVADNLRCAAEIILNEAP